MGNLDLVKLYMSVKNHGGWWDIFISEFRRRTGSQASDASLRTELSKRIGDIRWEVGCVLGHQRASELLPKLPRPPKKQDRFRDVLEWFITEALTKETL